MRTIAYLLCLGLTHTVFAEADTEATAVSEAALEAATRAQTLFQAGAYPAARAALEEAIAHDPSSPTLQANLGRVHEAEGNLGAAVAAYQHAAALHGTSDTEAAVRVRQTLRRLGAMLAMHDAQAIEKPREAPSLPAPKLAPKPAPPPQPRWTMPTAWSALGLLGGSLLMGTGALVADQRADSFVAGIDGSASQREGRRRRARAFAITADLMLVASVVTGTAALVGWLRHRKAEP